VCPGHRDIVLSTDDHDAERRAYAIGTKMVKAGEVDGTREEFTAAIKTAIEQPVTIAGDAQSSGTNDTGQGHEARAP
jgi:hypothetical protein